MGICVTFFVLVIFNESYVASTIVFAPCFTYYMYKTGRDLLGTEWKELIIRCSFCILIYGIVGYRVEVLSKQSFMGRESREKAFHRWMKIFETFPLEGIALIRNNYILYANTALKYILNVGKSRNADDDPIYDYLKGDLKLTAVRQWVKTKNDTKQRSNKANQKQFSVWEFLKHNEKGTIFQLLPKK